MLLAHLLWLDLGRRSLLYHGNPYYIGCLLGSSTLHLLRVGLRQMLGSSSVSRMMHHLLRSWMKWVPNRSRGHRCHWKITWWHLRLHRRLVWIKLIARRRHKLHLLLLRFGRIYVWLGLRLIIKVLLLRRLLWMLENLIYILLLLVLTLVL